MAFWDNWFGGHDAEVNPYGWFRRRFYDRVHSNMLVSGSKRRGDRGEFSDFARNALSNAGLLGLSGFLSGGWSMPAFLVGAKSFMTFNAGLSSIKGHLRAAALTDHALGGTYFEKLAQSKARLTPEAQRIIGSVFGRAGAVDVNTVRDLINTDPSGTRALLNSAFTNGVVDAAGRTKYLNDHEKSELSSIFGLGFLDHWSRTRLHPAIDASVGNRLSTGRATGKSFFQSLQSKLNPLSNADQESLFDNFIANNPNLSDADRKHLHNVLLGLREADSGSVKSFHQILGGAFGVGLASVIEGNWGNTAAIKSQAAQYNNLAQMVQQHHDYLSSMPEHLKVVVDTKTGLAMVNNQIALKGILGRGEVDPTIGGVGAGFKGSTLHADSASLPSSVNQNLGLLVREVISKNHFNPFVQDVAAHLDFGALPALVQQNAAIAAAGGGIHPGWAFILGALSDVPITPLPRVPLPPGKGKGKKGIAREGSEPAPKPLSEAAAPTRVSDAIALNPRSGPDGLFGSMTLPGRGVSSSEGLFGSMRPPARSGKGRTLDEEPAAHKGRYREYESGLGARVPARGGKGRMLEEEPVRGKGRYVDAEPSKPGRSVLRGAKGRMRREEPIRRKGQYRFFESLRENFDEGELEGEDQLRSRGGSEGEGLFRGHANRLGLHEGDRLSGENELWNLLLGLQGGNAQVSDQLRAASAHLSLKQWNNLGLHHVVATGAQSEGPTHDMQVEKARSLGAPAPVQSPLTGHASLLDSILTHHEFSESPNARALIGRELDRSGFFDFSRNPFGFNSDYVKGYSTFEQALGNAPNFEQVIHKLKDASLTAVESDHLHASLVRGILHHARSDVRRRNVLGAEFNDLAVQDHLRFNQGVLGNAHNEVRLAVNHDGGDLNAVHHALQNTPREFDHAIASIHPESRAVLNRTAVHGQLIGRLHTLYRG